MNAQLGGENPIPHSIRTTALLFDRLASREQYLNAARLATALGPGPLETALVSSSLDAVVIATFSEHRG
jgi:hypothetical protein